MPTWNTRQYERYTDERGRPFHDLVGRIGAAEPSYVVDLGCGTGELTATLAERWPEAMVHGEDSSPEMLKCAAAQAIPGRLDFTRADIRDWVPPRGVDVLVTNAALQWVPGHLELLDQLIRALRPGGWFAMQVPGNFDAPSHVLLTELRESPRWRERLGDDAVRPGAHGAAEYLAALAALGCVVDAWETTYLHVLAGPDPVLEWTRGTALLPVLDRLDDADAAEFEGEYAAALRAAYPPRDGRTMLPFRRVFAVAQKQR